MSRNPDTFRLLTPRERDCLRLLRKGLLTPQVASSLGITDATLNKHLASARRKLGVSRTMHALLLCTSDDEAAGSPSRSAIGAIPDSSPAVREFADAVETCATVQDAWDMLRNFVARLGVTYVATGVIAEPPGQLTNGARGIAMSGPAPVVKMYRDRGGGNADPVNHFIATQMKSALADNERLVKAIADQVPKPVAAFGHALLDENMRFALHHVERDRLTGAPLVNGFIVEPRAAADLRRNSRGNPRQTLQAISKVFWDVVQDKRLLCPIADLSHRQVEALTLSAGGFTIEESAERMNISRRSAERTLAGARKKLGARTTPAAIYRAMVYRVLVHGIL